jgi:hypothetical protein
MLGCNNPSIVEPLTNLKDCNTYEDTVYVLNYFSYENGKLKPPCDCSPDPQGCIESRYLNLQ